jgi:hypothetical protein
MVVVSIPVVSMRIVSPPMFIPVSMVVGGGAIKPVVSVPVVAGVRWLQLLQIQAKMIMTMIMPITHAHTERRLLP